MKNTITLRSVYGKMKSYTFMPVRQKNGMFPSCVKKVRTNTYGDTEMILSETEMNSPERDAFIPEDLMIEVEDGTTFDLDIPFERNKWESIKDSNLIAVERGAKDENGNLIIDGNRSRYGSAELWIERPGEDSGRRIKKIQLLTKAYNYIEQDSWSGMITKLKLLGKNMVNAAFEDVQNFLYEKAEKNPQSIIDLYTAPDTMFKLMLIDAKDKHIISTSKGVYMYGEVPLGVTDDSVILFLKSPANRQLYLSIRNETYPDMMRSTMGVNVFDHNDTSNTEVNDTDNFSDNKNESSEQEIKEGVKRRGRPRKNQ